MSTAETAILTTATTTAMTLTSLLNSLHTHLQTQTQLLPTLHAQLGLPATALEDELKVLQDQLIEGVERQIDLRRKQVDEWMEKCEGVESVCISYTKALGGNVKATGSSLGEIRKEQSLPRRYELVTEFQEKLRQAYHTKLEQLTTLTSRLNALARTLGTEYFSPDVLDATPAIDEPALDSAAPRDVTPERFLKLEKEFVRGKAEVTKRLHQLSSIFVQVDWLYTELGIPIPSPDDELDPSSSQRHMATDSSDPFCVSTPTPASRTTTVPLLFQNNTELEYQRTFNAFIARIEELDGQEPPESHIPVGLEGVEPSQGIIEWAAAQQASLEELKRQREAHIQSMYDQLEGLWRRLGVDEAAMDSFVDMHRGSTEETVREYEEELERMLELKQESMAQFVQSAREEVVKLWDDLMIGEEERADFAPFADDEMTEELLSIHEDEIRRLKEERRMKAPLLASIKKYFVICDEEKELQASASDQTRLLGRGRDPGRLLREEKMRKRVQKEKPRLEQDLLAAIPSWELETGKPFLVHGESILQLLHETVAAQEQESLKRKATRGGSASARATTPTAPSSNGYVPGGGGTKRAGTVTPAVRPRSAMASSSKTVPNKRQKLGDSTSSTTSNSTSHPSTSNSTSQRVPLSSHRGNSGGRGPATRAGSPPASKRPKTPGVPSSMSRPGGSNIAMPTARHASGPSSVRQGNVAFGSNRAASHGGAAPASVGASARRFQSAGAATHGAYTQGQGRTGPGAVAKAARASRESFKPRPSIDHLEMKEMKRSVGGGTRYGGVGVGPAVDEEEED